MTKNYTNILIVRTDRIGDVVLTIPAIKVLRQAYPDARISILVAPAVHELVDGNNDLDEILIDDRNGEHKGPLGFLKLIQILRQKRFDLAIVYHTKKRTNLTCFLAGIPTRVGYQNSKFGFLLNQPVLDTRHTGEKHEAQYCLDVLGVLGIKSNDLAVTIAVNKESLLWVDQFMNTNHIRKDDLLIAIHSGASDPAKRWPENHFAQLIDTLIDRYSARIVIIGSSQANDSALKIISLIRGSAINLTGKTTIGQLSALMMRSSLLVSNDSGPVHIAAGVGTCVVSIFTRNQPGINPARWKPLGTQSRVVSVTPAQSYGISFKKAQSMDTNYMELISVSEVLEAVDSLFKLC